MKDINCKYYTKWRNNTLISKLQTDKTYLILKMGDFLISTAGLGWYVLYMLRGIRMAIENGFVPVIDWKNCKIPQYSADNVGKENIWEYFFEQPCNVNVDQAYKSEDFFVIDDVREFVSPIPLDMSKFIDFQNEEVENWRIYFQKYIRLKQEIKEHFEKCAQKKLDNHSVGILARGTDYAELKPMGHAKHVSVDEIFNCIDELSEYNKIFLATEDESILKKFEYRYPGHIDAVEAKRYKNTRNNTLNLIYKENGYDRDIRYLYSIYMVSRCDSCIYTACGGSVIASLMRKHQGSCYKFLYHGCNRAKGIIVGSEIEKKHNQMMLVSEKPILFYALNTMKLLDIEEVDLILTDKLKQEYQKIIGSGEDYAIRINYIISDSYNIFDYMTENTDFMKTSKLILLYADYIIHGKDVIKEMSEKMNKFDGAYLWGVKMPFSDNTESINVGEKDKIPQKAYEQYSQRNYSLTGRYVFDNELKEIIKQFAQEKKEVTLVDIINEYIDRKKLFFSEYKRGIICSKIKDEDSLKKIDQLIRLLEEIQGQKIGDFASFRET